MSHNLILRGFEPSTFLLVPYYRPYSILDTWHEFYFSESFINDGSKKYRSADYNKCIIQTTTYRFGSPLLCSFSYALKRGTTPLPRKTP